MKKIIVWCIVLGITMFTVKAVAQQNSFAIEFKHRVGEKNLVLFTETYYNNFNEPFVVNKFRYYISNVLMVDEKGKQKRVNNFHHLVDEADSVSKKFYFNSVNLGKIVFIEFTIGVDSLRNFSGVQTDDLDPMKGMFWTWNNGYIFAKLEGQSDSSTASSNYFTYHIGGYKNQFNATRKIVLPIKKLSKEIIIQVDILKWFNAVHSISIQQIPICHQPGKLAMQLADNYATMFAVVEQE